jgi:hypothetical protein
MKFVITLSILLAVLTACTSAKDIGDKKGVIKLTELKKSYDVKVGDKMSYSVSIHGSVGSQAKVSVDQTDVVFQNEPSFKYNDKSRSKMSGGDGGVRTYTFDAKSVGTAVILIEKEFRGESTDTYELTINVTE